MKKATAPMIHELPPVPAGQPTLVGNHVAYLTKEQYDEAAVQEDQMA